MNHKEPDLKHFFYYLVGVYTHVHTKIEKQIGTGLGELPHIIWEYIHDPDCSILDWDRHYVLNSEHYLNKWVDVKADMWPVIVKHSDWIEKHEEWLKTVDEDRLLKIQTALSFTPHIVEKNQKHRSRERFQED